MFLIKNILLLKHKKMSL